MNSLKFHPLYNPKLNKSINMETLGYCLPDGKIKFRTNEVALKYAKNRVLHALHCKQPFERGIIISDSTILSEINGTYKSVDTNKELDCLNTIFIHGHPQDTPISQPDSKVLLLSNAKEIIAYNSKGEYSSLKKFIKPDDASSKFKKFIFACKNLFNCTNAEVDYLGTWHEFKNKIGLNKKIKTIESKITKTFTEKSNHQYSEAFQKSLDLYENTGQENYFTLPPHIRELVAELIKLDKEEIECSKEFTHNFWKENAYKYNLSYSTNYIQKGDM